MRVVGRYMLLAKLGGGGMADVYLAAREDIRAPKHEDLLALKLPRKDVGDSPEFVAMFLDEARLAARLDHPNIVKTIEVGEADGTQFIAMEYLEGQPFSRIIPKLPDLPLEVHIEVLLHVLSGIHYAHNLTDDGGKPLNVVHRDLTPQNIFVTYDGRIKILDFGIARAEGRSSQTRAGQIKGKVGYMSPEQAFGRELDRRADLFAIGVMLFEGCTGKRMWEGTKDHEVLTTLLGRRHNRSPQLIKPDVPDDLDAICHRALSVIDHRYQTAEELLADLERYVEANVERPSQEAVAKVVSEAFAEKRTKVRATIDDQLVKRQKQMTIRDSIPDTGEVVQPPSMPSSEAKASETPPHGSAGPSAPPKPLEKAHLDEMVDNALSGLDAIASPEAQPEENPGEGPLLPSTPDLKAHESDRSIPAVAAAAPAKPLPAKSNGAPRPLAPKPLKPPPPIAAKKPVDPVVAAAEAELPIVTGGSTEAEPPLVALDDPPPEPAPEVRKAEPSAPKIDHVAALANSHVPKEPTGRRKALTRPPVEEVVEDEAPAGLEEKPLSPMKMAMWALAVAIVAVLATLIVQRAMR